jgi:hypothetical protein
MKTLILVFASFLLLTGVSYAECPVISEVHFFVTKASPGEEQDKNPTYVDGWGGYFYEKAISCNAQKVSYHFLGAHYANHPGKGSIRIEILDGSNNVVGNKTIAVTRQMSHWGDIYDPSKKDKYAGEIDLGKVTAFSKVRFFAVPGNRAVIVSDLKITFSKSSCPSKKYSLTVKTDPDDSRVRIMTIGPNYYPGICLSRNKYHKIKVTHFGYQEGVVRVKPSAGVSSLSIDVTLKPK